MRWMAALALLLPAQEEEVRLDLLNKENVLASRLEGTWKASPDTVEGLVKEPEVSLTFTYDRTAVSDAALRKLAGRVRTKMTVYAIGRATRTGRPEQVPFLVTFWNGNPTLVIFEGDKEDPLAKWDAVRVSLARAQDPKDDLFFMILGDRETGPSVMFARDR